MTISHQISVDYEMLQFQQASQKSNKTVDQFVTHLCKFAVHCDFPDLDRELKSVVIQIAGLNAWEDTHWGKITWH